MRRVWREDYNVLTLRSFHDDSVVVINLGYEKLNGSLHVGTNLLH